MRNTLCSRTGKVPHQTPHRCPLALDMFNTHVNWLPYKRGSHCVMSFHHFSMWVLIWQLSQPWHRNGIKWHCFAAALGEGEGKNPLSLTQQCLISVASSWEGLFGTTAGIMSISSNLYSSCKEKQWTYFVQCHNLTFHNRWRFYTPETNQGVHFPKKGKHSWHLGVLYLKQSFLRSDRAGDIACPQWRRLVHLFPISVV